MTKNDRPNRAHREVNRRGIGIRWLLLGVGSLIVVLPVVAVLALQVYQNHLVQQTERSLIAQSVLIGELWRDAWLDEHGITPAHAPEVRPGYAVGDSYAPIEPTGDLALGVMAPLAEPVRFSFDRLGPKWVAGRRVIPTLKRAKIFNLSSVRIVDETGCVVAASGTWLGACFDRAPELASALKGRYSSIMRRRISDEPKPAIASISRGGDVRVFTAMPVFSDSKVIGAVWMSRTSMAPYKAAWLYRRPLLIGLGLSLLLAAMVSIFLARAITRPLRQITEAAEAVVRGQGDASLTPEGFAPREVHSLGIALGTMTRQLSGRAEYIADFAANVSHELKSPITAIRGAAELLREGLRDMPRDQRERFLANIDADAARMERLVTRLLELARIQSAPESAQAVELVPFFKRITESYQGRVVLDIDSAPLKITINQDHLESAVRNLLDNAVRYGAGKTVALSVHAVDDQVAIKVSDKGPGISEANQKRLFHRFFTTARDQGGTGLGLSIVQAVAHTRGGEVTFDTGPEGTVFTLFV